AELQVDGQVTLNGHAPLNNGFAVPAPQVDDTPTLPSTPMLPSEEQTEPLEPMETGQEAGDGAPIPLPFRLRNAWRTRWPPSWQVRVRAWQLVAAAGLVLVISGGFSAGVASAAPGSLLFGLRRGGQEVSILLDASAEGRTRQHLTAANQYLDDLDAIIA